MTNVTVPFRPDWVSAPGETIADLLEEKGWSQTELAKRMGFTRKHINELVAGKTALSADAALKLEATIGGSAAFWLAREAQYREALVRRVAEEALSGERAWLKELPLKDMIQFGWVKRLETVGAQVAECLRFFGVATVSAWREKHQRPLVAFRAAQGVSRSLGAIAAWLRQGERQAESLRCEPYTEAGFRAALSDLRAVTRERKPEVFVPQLVSSCAKHGVAVVFVPAPKGCPVSGATRWLTSDRAILQLSLRYKSDDHLWFTLFHEAGHIVLHRKTTLLFLEGVDAISETHEREADAFARDLLIAPVHAERLPALPKSAAAVTGFAQAIGVAPGVVVGRMQKEGLLPWSHLNHLKVRFQWQLPSE
jgi:HTH-type transcriptional regulator/antitoxin HigA